MIETSRTLQNIFEREILRVQACTYVKSIKDRRSVS